MKHSRTLTKCAVSMMYNIENWYVHLSHISNINKKYLIYQLIFTFSDISTRFINFIPAVYNTDAMNVETMMCVLERTAYNECRTEIKHKFLQFWLFNLFESIRWGQSNMFIHKTSKTKLRNYVEMFNSYLKLLST